MNNLEKLCSVFLPKNTLDNFDITNIEDTDKNEIHITLTEKNNPPKHKQKLIAKWQAPQFLDSFVYSIY